MLFRAAVVLAAALSTVVAAGFSNEEVAALGLTNAINSLPTTTEYEPTHQLYARVGQTGCTCNGYSYHISTQYNNALIPLLFRTGVVVPGVSATNTNGWCFRNGVMLPTYQNYISSALTTGVTTQYVNVSWARATCDYLIGAGRWTVSSCTSRIVTDFTALAVPNYVTTCTYPTTTTNWDPVDCACAFTCTNGYTKCGTECINPVTQQCKSGVPAPRRREVNVKGRWNGCPQGYDRCPTGNRRGASECIDVSSHIEACGACPFDPASVDCTAIPGAADVRCSAGKCLVSRCDRQHLLVNGTCVALPPKLLVGQLPGIGEVY